MLPLFPLPAVVFPRTRLPLHIFEDRYKEMVGDALRDQTEFGIVLAKEEGLVNVGCTVVVEQVLKSYEDGRMDILTAGVRRFEIVRLDQEKSYLRGEVMFFDDNEPGPAPRDAQWKALEEYRHWLELGEPQPGGEAVLSDPQLSFQLAHALRDLDFLQQLLHNRSEQERLEMVAKFLHGYIPRQRQTARMRVLAPLNGHGPKPDTIV